MVAVRVVMSPMDDSALGIPLVLAAEGDSVSHTKGANPWRDVDVVRNQQSLPGSQFDNKPLMPASHIIVRQDLCDSPFALDLNSAGSCRQRSGEFGIAC